MCLLPAKRLSSLASVKLRITLYLEPWPALQFYPEVDTCYFELRWHRNHWSGRTNSRASSWLCNINIAGMQAKSTTIGPNVGKGLVSFSREHQEVDIRLLRNDHISLIDNCASRKPSRNVLPRGEGLVNQ